jgi:ketosteroid isomerase-like protein
MGLSWRARHNRAVPAEAENHDLRLSTGFYEAWDTFRARGRDSGAVIEIDERHVWTLRNGRIVRLEWFHDLAAARQAAANRAEA